MKTSIAALICGIIFGLGLTISDMVNPARVIGFLDITGEGDLTLMLVMGSALIVTVIGCPPITRKAHPLLAEKFSLPTKTELALPLISGAGLFGVAEPGGIPVRGGYGCRPVHRHQAGEGAGLKGCY